MIWLHGRHITHLEEFSRGTLQQNQQALLRSSAGDHYPMNADRLLNPQELLAEARRVTGLQQFDGPPIEEPLERLTRSLRTEAALNSAGVQMWRARLLNALTTRLRARDWFHSHPEILQEKLPAMVVILGLARTGTTLLQRLLAADDRFYSAAWWETRFPVPTADDINGAKRIEAARAEIAALLQAQPDLAAIHPWDALGADEDILLIDHTLLSTTAEAFAHVPSYREWVHAQDLRPAYEYLMQLLRFLQWQKRRRGEHGERWVLKTPMHLGYVDVIAKVMPDVTFVQTHRDPITTIPSMASFVHELWAAGSDDASAAAAGRHWSGTLAEHLNRCLEMRAKLPPEKFVDVDFREMLTDPIAVVERIYRSIGLPLTTKARVRIEAYMQAHPREQRPKHEYTLEKFGLDRAQLEAQFREYRKRHILPVQE
jgi:hypothetical protein